jgi:hypothetical protein
MEDEIRYVPAGRYTTAGVVVEEEQPAPQRLPAEMAALMAAVSSVTPSPETWLKLGLSHMVIDTRTLCAVALDVPKDLVAIRCPRCNTLMVDILIPVARALSRHVLCRT